MISEETRKKLSRAAIKAHADPEIKKKYVNAAKMRYSNEINRKKHSELMKVVTNRKEHKEAVSKKTKDDWNKNPERKKKASKFHKELWEDPEYRQERIKDIKNRWKDLKFRKTHKEAMNREDVKLKCSVAGSKRVGPLNPSWKGGVSIEPYCLTWFDKEFRDFILERDGYKCQNPYCWHTNSVLTLHHIDYVKKNCDRMNIITLCNSCNPRANKNRKYWKRLYRRLLNESIHNTINR